MNIKADQTKQALAHIQTVWDEFNTGYPLDYQFVDASLSEMYRAEEKLSTMLGLFTGLAIFVAAFGLLGLVTFATRQRTKEIGIRKVLSASVQRIVLLLTSELLQLVILAFLLASPVAWYFLNGWLTGFPYRIQMSLWTFVLSGAAALLVALLTMSYHSIRAARSNPVKALRYE